MTGMGRMARDSARQVDSRAVAGQRDGPVGVAPGGTRSRLGGRLAEPRRLGAATERRAIACDSSLVSLARSASNLTAMLPTLATTPVPSADTDNPDDLGASFTCEVPLPLGHLNARQVEVSLTGQRASRIQAQCQSTTRGRPRASLANPGGVKPSLWSCAANRRLVRGWPVGMCTARLPQAVCRMAGQTCGHWKTE